MIGFRNEFEDREEWKAMLGMMNILDRLFPMYKDEGRCIFMFESDEVKIYIKMMNIYDKLEKMKCMSVKQGR